MRPGDPVRTVDWGVGPLWARVWRLPEDEPGCIDLVITGGPEGPVRAVKSSVVVVSEEEFLVGEVMSS